MNKEEGESYVQGAVERHVGGGEETDDQGVRAGAEEGGEGKKGWEGGRESDQELQRIEGGKRGEGMDKGLSTRRWKTSAREVRVYNLNESGAKLLIHEDDITCWSKDGKSDAIVNSANQMMLGGGGVDGAIHRAAGPELIRLCREVPEVRPHVRCPLGEARTTRAGRLPVAFVIHTVGPTYESSESSAPVLSSAYKSCVQEAIAHGVRFICFPAISCGIFRYPAKMAAEVALNSLKESAHGIEEVHFMLPDPDVWNAWVEASDSQLSLLHPT